MTRQVKAIILAAGQGTRLHPFTEDRPKCLVELNRVPLLDVQMSVLRSCGVSDIAVVGGYRAEMLAGKAARVYINHDFATTNMVHSLLCAANELDSDVVVAYGDIVYSRQVLGRLLLSPCDAAVVVDVDWLPYWRLRFTDPLEDAETLRVNEEGHIVEIGQRPRHVGEIEGQYIGLLKFSAVGLGTLLATVRQAHRDGRLGGRPPERAYMTDLLQAMIDAGHPVCAVPVSGGWVEVDTVRDLGLDVTRDRVAEILEAVSVVRTAAPSDPYVAPEGEGHQ